MGIQGRVNLGNSRMGIPGSPGAHVHSRWSLYITNSHEVSMFIEMCNTSIYYKKVGYKCGHSFENTSLSSFGNFISPA